MGNSVTSSPARRASRMVSAMASRVGEKRVCRRSWVEACVGLIERNHQGHVACAEGGDFAQQWGIRKAHVLGEHAERHATLHGLAVHPAA
jgi:hypothetical protein